MSNLPYISPDLIQNYQNHIQTSGSYATSKRKIASLKKFFNWAQNEGHIDTNPLANTLPNISTNPSSTDVQINTMSTKHLNVTNILRIALGGAMIVVTFLILRSLKVPIPFIYTPAAENTNLITISGGESPVPSINPSVLPTSIPTPVASPISSNTASPIATGSGTINVGPENITPAPNSSNGILTLEGSNPGIKGVGGLLISSENISLSSNDGSDGEITLNPDGSGKLNLILEGSAGNQINATSANLKAGSLYYGYVGNNNTSYNLLSLQSGSNPTTKFSVLGNGNTYIGGDITSVKNINFKGDLKLGDVTRLSSNGRLQNLSGIYQTSGLVDISQGSPDYFTVNKLLTNNLGPAKSDSFIINLDESELSNPSSYDSLVVNRKSGNSDAYAIYVPSGNVKFDQDLGLGGNFTATDGTFNDQLTVTGKGLFTVNNADYISKFINNGDSTDRTGLLIQTGLSDQTAAQTSTLIQFNDADGDSVGSITFGSSTTAYNTTSDRRLKENIVDSDLGLSTLMQIQVRDFNFINDPENKKVQGFIAQELEQVYPQAVTVPSNPEKTWMVDYSKLTPILVKSIQDLNNQFTVISNTIGENIIEGTLVTKDQIVNGTFKFADVFTNTIVANVVKGSSFVAENIQTGTIIATDATIKGTVKGTRFIAENIESGAITTQDFASETVNSVTASIDNLIIKNGLVTPKVQTNKIAGLEENSNIKIEANTDIQGKTTTTSLDVNEDAKVAGTIYADRVVANSIEGQSREEIENLLSQIDESKEMIRQAQGWETYIASGSAKLDEVASNKIFVTEQAVLSNLTVTGNINLPGFIMSGNESKGTSLDTLSSPLYIQSLALAPIELMAGKIKISTNGDVEFLGNVKIAGKVESNDIKSSTIETNKVIIAGTTNESVTQNNEGVIETNATAGSNKVPIGTSEIAIKNPNISDSTLVYVTPTSNTNNQILFVKSKEIGKFVVGFTNPTETEASFNWWVIDVK